MIELEKTYLAKKLPDGLKNCRFKEILDIYLPESSEHPKLRIRKNGNNFEMTKKAPVDGKDASCQEEQTIALTEKEFNALKRIKGKILHKLRYYYPYDGRIAEIDFFQDSLRGLVLIDFEFSAKKEKDRFLMPDFCLAEVTQEDFIAGGMLCGKSYQDIQGSLERFGYKKLFF